MFEAIARSISSECSSNNFRRCGIYLFNPDAVDYNKCDKLAEEACMFHSSLIKCSKYFNDCKYVFFIIFNENLLNEFNKCSCASSKWDSDERAS